MGARWCGTAVARQARGVARARAPPPHGLGRARRGRRARQLAPTFVVQTSRGVAPPQPLRQGRAPRAAGGGGRSGGGQRRLCGSSWGGGSCSKSRMARIASSGRPAAAARAPGKRRSCAPPARGARGAGDAGTAGAGASPEGVAARTINSGLQRQAALRRVAALRRIVRVPICSAPARRGVEARAGPLELHPGIMAGGRGGGFGLVGPGAGSRGPLRWQGDQLRSRACARR
jgi:hypothetical protein